MRKKIIAGNWKMNLTLKQAHALTDSLLHNIGHDNTSEILLSPPSVYLDSLAVKTRHFPHLFIAAQNCSEHDAGAYTGEVSAGMLASLGITHCIVGHSERRSLFGESDGQVAQKLLRLLGHDIHPVFCCGETLPQRESQKHETVIRAQLENALFTISPDDIGSCIIAYEPVWAIGTGVTASPQQAQEIHHFIREEVSKKFGGKTAENISILYGGSVTASNAADLFSCPDVDGALVGGASLKAGDFLQIIRGMREMYEKK